MPYPMFDRSRLHLKPLAERVHDMTLAEVLPLDHPCKPFADPALPQIAARVVQARRVGAPVILMMGAHVIKTGLSRFVIDLMARGIVTHVGMNGAGPIHDYELALIGATTESVARYIQEGQFGLWQETGRINDIVAAGVRDGLGYGEALGRAIQEANGKWQVANSKWQIANSEWQIANSEWQIANSKWQIANSKWQIANSKWQIANSNPQSAIRNPPFPHRDVSILAAGYRLRVPITVHIGLGYDIIHEHPNCDAAALGEASYRDFLIFTQAITQLQGGVLLNFGTAVMGPEVYLKALSMARNVAHQEGRRINEFTTAVFDLQDLGPDLRHEAPRTDARYYYRPFKTILVRTVQDGGESFYVRGDHRATLPTLYREVCALMGDGVDEETSRQGTP